MVGARNEFLISAFGRVIAEARFDAGLSQEDLSFAAGIDRTFVGRIERGERQATISVLFALAGALNVQPAELLRRTQRQLDAGQA